MNRLIQSKCSVMNSSGEFVIELKQTDVSCFILELTMLLMKQVYRLTFMFEDDIRVDMRLQDDLPHASKMIVNKKGNGLFFDFSVNHLEYLLAFLLRAYRDGVAEVDHIHLEGDYGPQSYDLTFIFDSYSPSLTPEEAAKLMT